MVDNGAIPEDQLRALSTPGSLLPAAAASFEQLLREAAADGQPLTGTEAAIEAYRPLSQQVSLFTDRYQTAFCEFKPGRVDRRVFGDVPHFRRPGQAAAAVPGESNHGFGNAVDFQNLGGDGGPGHRWMTEHAPAHGWSNDEGMSVEEPHHWVFVADLDPLATEEEDDMTPEQERLLLDVHAALGAGGAQGMEAAETVLGVARTIRASTTGVPEAFGHLVRVVEAVPAATWSTLVQRTTGDVAALQELADIKTFLLNMPPTTVDVDEAALAASLAPLLEQAANTLSDEALDDLIAKLAAVKAHRSG
ncbi:D-alanyl-D-alanine carboxypeptidase family protein [Cellulomonas sp. P5_C5]